MTSLDDNKINEMKVSNNRQRATLVSIYLYAWLQNYSFSWNLEFINLITTVPYMANKRNEFHGVQKRTNIYLNDYTSQ